MTDQPSQLSHARGTWQQGMQHPGTIATMLINHRNCTAGYGVTQNSCGRKQYLLELKEQMGSEPGWDFLVPPPDGMLCARQDLGFATFTEAEIDVHLPADAMASVTPLFEGR